MQIPNMIDPSVPIGKDDSENVELEKFGEPVVPAFEIPYHTEIMEKFNGIDLDSAVPTENDHMRRYSVQNYAHRMRTGRVR